ncbi:hypothetical protein [Gorillibacterium sp. CAU 1737]|uniref:hypothetical protein n=1 Tax=Gorillibacterium sp. CAU 1737 TaxID=3140362 RepID=UPI0032604813
MSKPKRTSWLFVLVLLFTISAAFPGIGHAASADNGKVSPCYQYVSIVGASLLVGSGGQTYASGDVYVSGAYDSQMTIELQRSSGKGWSAVKSWSKDFTGKGSHSFEKETYVSSGYTYRVVTTVAVKSGGRVIETVTATSSETKY